MENRRNPVCFFILIYLHITHACRGDVHSVYRNVDILRSNIDLDTSLCQYNLPHLSTCSVVCSGDETCASAVYHETKQVCYLLPLKNIFVFDATDISTFSLLTTCPIYSSNVNSSVQDLCYVTIRNGTDTQIYTGKWLEAQPWYQGVGLLGDCQDAYQNGDCRNGKVYSLWPDPRFQLIKAVCQCDDSAGWTVIQRRLDGTVDFYRGFQSYKNGFGEVRGEYWIGLEAIYFLTRVNRKVSFYLEAHDGEVRTANYSLFYVDGADTDYLLHIDGYSGDAGDSMAEHNNAAFSTYDYDADNHTVNCAETYRGGWWYTKCHEANLNGIWYSDGDVTEYGAGASWEMWKGYFTSYKTIFIRISN